MATGPLRLTRSIAQPNVFFQFAPNSPKKILGYLLICSNFKTALDSKDGYSALATISAERGWKMFRVRPKGHMWVHLVKLGPAI